jgi:putative oxidoreductase
MNSLEKHSDTAALIGRLFFSSMLLLLGYGKLTGYAGTVSYMGSLGLPAPHYSLCLPSSLRSALAC